MDDHAWYSTFFLYNFANRYFPFISHMFDGVNFDKLTIIYNVDHHVKFQQGFIMLSKIYGREIAFNINFFAININCHNIN